MYRLRWAVVALVLAVAGVLALWTQDVVVQQDSPAATATPSRSERDLAAARASAGLRPCSPPRPDAAGPTVLRGVTATCLANGFPIDVGAALGSRPALINVWASWCQPCREELPLLDRYAQTAGAVQVLGIQVQSDPVDGLNLLASLGVHFPSVADTADTVGRALRLPNYLPVSYVLLADGTLRQVQPPTPFSSLDQVRTTVERYLGDLAQVEEPLPTPPLTRLPAPDTSIAESWPSAPIG